MHVRLARSALGPLLALSCSLPLPHVFAENAEFAITAPVGSVGGRRRTPCRPADPDGRTDEYHPERGEEREEREREGVTHLTSSLQLSGSRCGSGMR